MDDQDLNQGVHFEEAPSFRRPYAASSAPSGMAGWLIRHSRGALTEEKDANIVLLIAMAIMAIAALYFFFGFGSGVKKAPPITPEQRSYMETGHGLEAQ